MNLELQGITKRFGSLVANDHIDLSIAPGTIHALLGENGAGKTTLMNILYGLTQPDEGTILADGKPLTIHSPKDAIAAGIGMVHQHFMLVPVFTVAENVTLGDEETRALGLLDRRRMRRKVRDLSRAVRAAGRSGRADRGPAGRRAAAGGDPQGAGPRRPGADPGRADGGADPRRDRGPVPDHAGAAGKRPGHRLHLAQAQGGAGHRGHGDDPAPRPGGRRSARRAPARTSWPR